MISGCVPLPDGPPGGLKGLFWAVGFLNAEAVLTLLVLGAAAELEYVFAAGDVCTEGGFWSTASLGNK